MLATSTAAIGQHHADVRTGLQVRICLARAHVRPGASSREKVDMTSAYLGPSPTDGEPSQETESQATPLASAARPLRSRRIRRAVLPVIRRLFNPLTMRLAGGRYMTMMAVVQHRGRSSGRAYATPTAAGHTPDGFVIPMTFGPSADWVQNVLAARECVIKWNGVDYHLVEPEIVDWSAATPAFPPWERVMLHLIGMTNFLQVRHA
jgi:hypothetical protein